MAKLRVLSVCSGVGMLDEGFHAAMRGRTQVVAYLERQAFPAHVLLTRMAEQALAPAPVWCGDFREADLSGLEPDGLLAGIPCQPHSSCGKRQHTADERWLWPDLWATARKLGCWFIALENVRGFIRGGLPAVLDDLAAEGGWDAEWTTLAASALGAPHRRERVFVLAWRVSDPRSSRLWEQPRRGCWARGSDAPQPRVLGAELAHAHEGGQQEFWPAQHDHGGDAPGHDPDGRNEAVEWPWPPGPNDAGGWSQADPATFPAFRRGPDGVATGLDVARTARLHASGNGVVAQQAAVAYRILGQRLGWPV